AEALREIAADPLPWLRLEARKAAIFWSRMEWKTNVSMAFVETFSPVLRYDPVGFGLLAILGACGLALLFARGPDPARWIVAAYLLVPFATCVLFFVSGEYRHPAGIVLAIATGAPAQRLPVRKLLPALAAMAVAAVLVLLPHEALAITGNPS